MTDQKASVAVQQNERDEKRWAGEADLTRGQIIYGFARQSKDLFKQLGEGRQGRDTDSFQVRK